MIQAASWSTTPRAARRLRAEGRKTVAVGDRIFGPNGSLGRRGSRASGRLRRRSCSPLPLGVRAAGRESVCSSGKEKGSFEVQMSAGGGTGDAALGGSRRGCRSTWVCPTACRRRRGCGWTLLGRVHTCGEARCVAVAAWSRSEPRCMHGLRYPRSAHLPRHSTRQPAAVLVGSRRGTASVAAYESASPDRTLRVPIPHCPRHPACPPLSHNTRRLGC